MRHAILWTLCWGLIAADLVEVTPLGADRILVHIDEGHVIHHGKGQKRSAERVVLTPVDPIRASDPGTYRLASADDPRYAEPRAPVQVGRKAKGTDFAWLVESWDQAANRAININPDHAKEHWITLVLPEAMTPGCRYTLDLGGLVEPGTVAWTWDPATSRSEAIHVNLIGYRPDAREKFAYVYAWLGDLGHLDVRSLVGRPFHLIDQVNRKKVFTGAVAFRAPFDQAETGHASDSPPHGNFLKADVAECDFSPFTTPGRYVVSVDGLGCSFPFTIAADIYREPFRTVARGLYHNRSGIALTRPYTDFERPAPHNPQITPGFAGKLVYTSSRFVDWTNGDGAKADVPAIEAGIRGPIDSTGWYQDAGDWDGYWSHLNVPTILLFAAQLAPQNFSDGELNIPESGNGIPDLIDEAAWLPRFGHRLRHELMAKGYGSGGLGLRVCGDHFGGDGEGVPSYEDVHRQWIASGEDPWSTYRYAAAAAHLALVLGDRADPEGVDWRREAEECYAWAAVNTRPGDEGKKTGVGEPLREPRAYAAAALWALTGETRYQDQLRVDTAWITADTLLWHAQPQAAYAVLLGGRPLADAELHDRLRAAVLRTAEEVALTNRDRRALRWGGQWFMPMLVGQQTTPWILEAAVAAHVLRDEDPERAARFRSALTTTCDYFLGTNALNQTWVTGLGPRHPTQVFHMDAWYNGKTVPHPGIIPYGPWRKTKDLGMGPWDTDWPNQTCHPGIDAWPGNERWFDNRCNPLGGEFTVHQTTCWAAATFGILCAAAE